MQQIVAVGVIDYAVGDNNTVAFTALLNFRVGMSEPFGGEIVSPNVPVTTKVSLGILGLAVGEVVCRKVSPPLNSASIVQGTLALVGTNC